MQLKNLFEYIRPADLPSTIGNSAYSRYRISTSPSTHFHTIPNQRVMIVACHCPLACTAQITRIALDMQNISPDGQSELRITVLFAICNAL